MRGKSLTRKWLRHSIPAQSVGTKTLDKHGLRHRHCRYGAARIRPSRSSRRAWSPLVSPAASFSRWRELRRSPAAPTTSPITANSPTSSSYLLKGALVGLFFVLHQALVDQYRPRPRRLLPENLGVSFLSWNFACATFLLVAFLTKTSADISRGFAITFYFPASPPWPWSDWPSSRRPGAASAAAGWSSITFSSSASNSKSELRAPLRSVALGHADRRCGHAAGAGRTQPR